MKKSMSFWAKVGFAGRKNSLIVHIPVSVMKGLKLKLKEFVSVKVSR